MHAMPHFGKALRYSTLSAFRDEITVFSVSSYISKRLQRSYFGTSGHRNAKTNGCPKPPCSYTIFQ